MRMREIRKQGAEEAEEKFQLPITKRQMTNDK